MRIEKENDVRDSDDRSSGFEIFVKKEQECGIRNPRQASDENIPSRFVCGTGGSSTLLFSCWQEGFDCINGSRNEIGR